MIQVKVTVFFLLFFFLLNVKFHNTFDKYISNEYASIDETSKMNGPVRGHCIACDALLIFASYIFDKDVGIRNW